MGSADGTPVGKQYRWRLWLLRLTEAGGQDIGVAPVFYDLAVRDPEDFNRPNLDLLASGSQTLEVSLVGAPHRDAGYHPVPFGYQVLDSDADVGEGFAGLREGLREGVDEFGRRIAGK